MSICSLVFKFNFVAWDSIVFQKPSHVPYINVGSNGVGFVDRDDKIIRTRVRNKLNDYYRQPV
jgi:hypothetical protein